MALGCLCLQYLGKDLTVLEQQLVTLAPGEHSEVATLLQAAVGLRLGAVPSVSLLAVFGCAQRDFSLLVPSVVGQNRMWPRLWEMSCAVD